jgi:release factor glutamine methyltransferase
MVDTTFYGLRLLHEPGRVFTPRPTTELLVAEALELEPRRIADVGTGSGAIAVALAVHEPRAEVWATDICADAVAVARANVARHRVAERVHVRRADLLDGVPGDLDLIVANLPYLPDSQHLAEYEDEPETAVYAPGDGLAYYRRLVASAEPLLRPRGRLAIQYRGRVLEAGRGELSALRQRLESPAWVAS